MTEQFRWWLFDESHALIEQTAAPLKDIIHQLKEKFPDGGVAANVGVIAADLDSEGLPSIHGYLYPPPTEEDVRRATNMQSLEESFGLATSMVVKGTHDEFSDREISFHLPGGTL